MKRIIILTLTIASAGVLFGKTSIKFLALVFILSIIASCIIYLIEKNITHPTLIYIHPKYALLDIFVSIWLMARYYSKWSTYSSVMTFASKVNIPVALIVGVAALLFTAFALHAFDSVFCLIDNLIEKVSKNSIGVENPYSLLALFIISLMQNFILNYSGLQTIESIGRQSIVATALNTSFFFGVNILFAALLRNWKVSLTLTTIIVWVWSIADYYVVKFHGSPLYFSEFANARTAANVMSGYELNINGVVIIITLIAIALIAEIVLFISPASIFSKDKKKLQIACTTVLLILCVGVNIIGYRKVDPSSHGWAPWTEGLETGGFIYESVFDLQKRQNPVVEPDGYNIESIEKLKSDINNSNSCPDIILILNETFCDLSYSVNYKSDIDPMKAFKDIDGASYGHAVVANIGGGTNDSEFELLTSNSRYLLRSSAPFTFLSEKQIKNSLVRFLKEGFGYETTAMHCGIAGNYSRNIAYPYLGFDNIYLGKDAFKYQDGYGNRPWLDSENYHDLIDHYEEGGEKPRFMYLLTFQNHGGYEQNNASSDIVHVETDFGDLTDDMNEYLTSIKSSAEAFRELTEYFKNSDRDVIVCMVGDHAPAFIADLPNDTDSPADDETLNKCIVPYVIWSNFNANVTSYIDYATMTDLIPMTLKAAGLPLSAFYKTVLELHEELPIRTKTGKYYDRSFQSGAFEDNSDIPLLSEYYYMVYNSLHRSDDYIDELYTVAANQ